jgi:hypothetical protein
VAGARVLQVDAVVLETFAVEAVAESGTGERVDGVLFEDAGADPRLDVLPRAVLEDDAVDALEGQQAREEQAGGTGPDDPDLSAPR